MCLPPWSENKKAHQEGGSLRSFQRESTSRTSMDSNREYPCGGTSFHRIQGSQDNQETIQEERFSKWRSGKIKMQQLSCQMKRNESRDWGTHCYWQRRENRRIGNSDWGETQNLLGMPGFQNLWKLWWVQFGFKGVPTVIFRLKKAISIDQFRFIQYFDFTRKSTRNGKEQESVNGCQVKGLRM